MIAIGIKNQIPKIKFQINSKSHKANKFQKQIPNPNFQKTNQNQRINLKKQINHDVLRSDGYFKTD